MSGYQDHAQIRFRPVHHRRRLGRRRLRRGAPARYGARVAICEESRVGGTCVIRGCVPKKLLVYGAHFADAFDDAAGFGWTVHRAEPSTGRS